MTWTWCTGITAWVAPYGPVPDGYVWPALNATTPDLTALSTPLGAGGEIDVFTAAEDYDLCSYDGTPTWVAWTGTPPKWVGPGTLEAGDPPAGPWMFVVVYGPNYDETDPEPTWDPSETLGVDPYVPPPPAPLYEVIVVDQDGTPYGTAADARLGNVSWELNGVGAAAITLATVDPDAALMLPGREVQIYHQGNLIWWGPIVRPQAGLHETTWQCAELMWHFAHRYMGRADRVNQLVNGDFEDGETDWSFSGVTHSVDTAKFYDGTQALKLEGATANHTGYAKQTWTHPAGGYPTGDFLTGAVYVWVSAADYVGGAAGDFGLLLRHKNAAGAIITTNGSADSPLPAIIDDDTPKDKWVLLRTGVPNVQEGDTVEMLLFPPHGVATFDIATLTFMESLSFGYPVDDVDVTDIIGEIVDYAQNRVFDHGKSDLNIGTAGDAVGITRQVAYQFEEHRNILDAILEYVREGLCDISIEISPTVRTFTVWPKSADSRTPEFGKGSLYETTLELDVNVADFTWSWDLEQAASNVVLLGPGDGPDRPEGNATDSTLLGGAFTVEIVEQAPDNTTIGQLDDRAAERLKVAARPEILEVTTLPGSGVIGSLTVGDTVPVLLANGWVDIDAVYRVARIEADLLKDQATITLNPVPT